MKKNNLRFFYELMHSGARNFCAHVLRLLCKKIKYEKCCHAATGNHNYL